MNKEGADEPPAVGVLCGGGVQGSGLCFVLPGRESEAALCGFRVGRGLRVMGLPGAGADNPERVERPADSGLHPRRNGGNIRGVKMGEMNV
jgi:hypothetical protein